MTKKLLMGNEAMAHAALEAGVGVVAGYPGTPSSEIVETVAKQVGRGVAHGVHVEWSTNEKAALELLFGASLAGKRGLFTCKQMGLNVASDALMSLNYVSVRAGLVLIVADDPGPISSQTEQDTRRFAAFAKVPVLDPSSPEQAFAMVKAAFELSERYHTPVIVRPTTRVDHASAFFDIVDETRACTFSVATGTSIATSSSDPESTQALPSGFTHDPDKWVIFPRRAYEAHGEINDRLADIAHVFATNPAYSQFNPMEETASTDADSTFDGGVGLGIVASGISAAYAREALRIVREHGDEAGLRVPSYRFMQIGTPYPFPEDAFADFARGLDDILVLEELDHVVEDELTRFAGRTHATFNVHGKLTGEARDRGENDVDDIALRIERFLGLAGRLSMFRLRDESRRAELGIDESSSLPVRLSDEAASELPVRPPVLCAGCPHRGSFFAVKKALGDTPAVLCGDIGCYTLGNAKPLEAVDTCLCMGGGITMAQGVAVADPLKKAVAFIGDSTFFASGMTGIANAAYNGHDITIIVLDNSTTAMTGAQPHPGTGKTLMGGFSEPLNIESVLLSCGIKFVLRANPLDLEASTAVVGAALDVEGPSAVIFQSPCAQIVPPDPPALVNRNTCKGCKRCITAIGCPAISFNTQANGPRSGSRGQAVIDQSLCVGCNLCVQVCPFHAILPSEVVAGLTVIEGATVEAAYAPEHPTSETAVGAASGIADRRGAATVSEVVAGFAAAAATIGVAREDAGYDVVVADEDASYNFEFDDDLDVGALVHQNVELIDELDPTLAFEPCVMSDSEPVGTSIAEQADTLDGETVTEDGDELVDGRAAEPDAASHDMPAEDLEAALVEGSDDGPDVELAPEPTDKPFDELPDEPTAESEAEPIEEATTELADELDVEAEVEPSANPNVEPIGESTDGVDAELGGGFVEAPVPESAEALHREQEVEPADELYAESDGEPYVEPADELPDEAIAEPDARLAEQAGGSDVEVNGTSVVDAFGSPLTSEAFPPYPTFENPWELDRADALAPERVKSIESNRDADQPFVSALDPEIALIADDSFADNWTVLDDEFDSDDEVAADEELGIESAELAVDESEELAEPVVAGELDGAAGDGAPAIHIPDFGVAADFEEEIEELEAEEALAAQAPLNASAVPATPAPEEEDSDD